MQGLCSFKGPCRIYIYMCVYIYTCIYIYMGIYRLLVYDRPIGVLLILFSSGVEGF